MRWWFDVNRRQWFDVDQMRKTESEVRVIGGDLIKLRVTMFDVDWQQWFDVCLCCSHSHPTLHLICTQMTLLFLHQQSGWTLFHLSISSFFMFIKIIVCYSSVKILDCFLQ